MRHKIMSKEEQLKAEIAALLKEQEKEAPVEETSAEVSSEPEAYVPKDEWEEKAMKIGWDPNKTGDTAVDAKEYVLRKPLFNRIEEQSKQLRDLKEQQRKNATHLAQVRKEAYEQAIREIEARRETAVEESNMHEFRRLDQQAKNLNQQMHQDPIVNNVQATPPEIDPEIKAFGERSSSWYNDSNAENRKMKAAAEAVDNFLVKQAEIDGKEVNVRAHLEAIEQEVRRMFPHRFEQAAPKTAPTQQVGRSTAQTVNTKSSTNLVARLSPQQRELGEKFHRDNPAFTLEEYAKELDKLNRLAK